MRPRRHGYASTTGIGKTSFTTVAVLDASMPCLHRPAGARIHLRPLNMHIHYCPGAGPAGGAVRAPNNKGEQSLRITNITRITNMVLHSTTCQLAVMVLMMKCGVKFRALGGAAPVWESGQSPSLAILLHASHKITSRGWMWVSGRAPIHAKIYPHACSCSGKVKVARFATLDTGSRIVVGNTTGTFMRYHMYFFKASLHVLKECARVKL